MASYSIKDIETLSGIKAHTLRIWEQRYDFLKPERTDTNIRYYSDEQLKKILNVSLLNRHGYKISHIAEMSESDLNKQVVEISSQQQTPDDTLDALTQCMVDFDEDRFEKLVANGVTRYGFERMFSEVVFPFLVRTGILWSTGTVLPVQEHFVSNIIRRKIMAAIDGQVVVVTNTSKRFVLFLPEGENHELMLLFIEYMLRKNNHKTAYIGNSTPVEEIKAVSRIFKPHYLVTYVTVPQTAISLQQFINNLSKAYPSQTILIGGVQLELHQPKLPANARLVSSGAQLLSAIR